MNQGKYMALLLAGIALTLTLCACSVSDDSPNSGDSAVIQPSEESASTEGSGDTGQTPETSVETLSLSLAIGEQTFPVRLENSETAKAFLELLPLTLDMSELNGNEKFYYMDDTLPTNAENPGEIHAGDLMLYGDSCLVLFFDTFSTSYSYTRLGSVTDASGLVDALDRGTVTITFTPAE